MRHANELGGLIRVNCGVAFATEIVPALAVRAGRKNVSPLYCAVNDIVPIVSGVKDRVPVSKKFGRATVVLSARPSKNPPNANVTVPFGINGGLPFATWTEALRLNGVPTLGDAGRLAIWIVGALLTARKEAVVLTGSLAASPE